MNVERSGISLLVVALEPLTHDGAALGRDP